MARSLPRTFHKTEPIQQWAVIVLMTILVVSAAFRLIGISEGLPQVIGADEGFEAHRALKLGAGEFDFERTDKGGFFYLLFVEYGIYYAVLWLLDQVETPADLARHFATDLSPFWMMGRITQALLGTLTCLVTFVYGRRMYSTVAGLFAATIVALSTLHIERCRLIGVDPLMTLLVLVVVGLAVEWSRPEGRARPLALGTAFGAAVMTKTPAVVSLLPILVGNWLRYRKGPVWKRFFGRRMLIALVVAAVVFSIGNPGFILNLDEKVEAYLTFVFGDPSIASGSESDRASDTSDERRLGTFYLHALQYALSSPILIVAALGTILALIRRSNSDWVVLSFVLPYLFMIANAKTSHLFYPRYVLPVVPLLALVGGRFVAEFFRRLPFSARARSIALSASVVLLIAPLSVQSFTFLETELNQDTRLSVLQWVESNLPAETTVFLIGNPMVDTAPNMTVPLRNTDANLDELMAEMGDEGALKQEFFALRKDSKTGIPYDLVTARHFEVLEPLQYYLSEGVECFILANHHFQADRIADDLKHSPKVLRSRELLHRGLVDHPEIELAYKIDPAAVNAPGPGFEVFVSRRLAADLP